MFAHRPAIQNIDSLKIRQRNISPLNFFQVSYLSPPEITIGVVVQCSTYIYPTSFPHFAPLASRPYLLRKVSTQNTRKAFFGKSLRYYQGWFSIPPSKARYFSLNCTVFSALPVRLRGFHLHFDLSDSQLRHSRRVGRNANWLILAELIFHSCFAACEIGPWASSASIAEGFPSTRRPASSSTRAEWLIRRNANWLILAELNFCPRYSIHVSLKRMRDRSLGIKR